MVQCHVHTVVHGECTSYFKLEYLLYPPAVEPHVTLFTHGTLALVGKPVRMPVEAGSEHLVSLSKSAWTSDQ